MDTLTVIKKEVSDIVTQAEGYQITNQAQYDGTATFLKAIKGLQHKIKECFDPIVESALKTHREAIAKRKEHLDPVLKAEAIIKEKLIDYDTEQERIRREQQAKLDRQAEAERRKKEEQERAWREKEEAKRREAERLEAEGKAEEAAKAQAEADKAAAKADERQEAANNIVAPIAAPKVEKPKGLSFLEVWSAEVVDKSQLPVQWMIPNQQALDAHARNTKGQISIPGVKFNCKKVASSRAA